MYKNCNLMGITSASCSQVTPNFGRDQPHKTVFLQFILIPLGKYCKLLKN